LAGYGNLRKWRKVIRLNLLILANEFEDESERFSEFFDEAEVKSLADSLIDVNSRTSLEIDGRPIEEWDAVYIQSEPKAFNYSRVLLETISRKEINCNLNPSSIFILGKKPYLFTVLADKGVSIPKQVSISTEKGLTEMQKDLNFPVVGKEFSSLEMAEVKVFEEFSSLKSFAELSEHGKDYLMIRELHEEEPVFDVLYIDGHMISLKLEDKPWEKETYDSIARKYHSISGDQKDLVRHAVESVGTEICKVRLQGDKILDVQNNPELEEFKKKSGKNVYGRIADLLKGDES
jgi:glutathione synthase/RimK-type ligase-like ATP-grasp enzyme